MDTLGKVSVGKTKKERTLSKPQSRVDGTIARIRGGFLDVDPASIDANPDQPRSELSMAEDVAFLALVESIRDEGVLQPPLVKPVAGGRYQLLAGERRVRAARAAELAKIPVKVVESDADSAVVAVIENQLRKDLHPVELALAVQRLAGKKYKGKEIGQVLGLPAPRVSEYIKLAALPADIRADWLSRDNVSTKAVVSIARLDTAAEQTAAWRELIGAGEGAEAGPAFYPATADGEAPQPAAIIRKKAGRTVAQAAMALVGKAEKAAAQNTLTDDDRQALAAARDRIDALL